LVQLQRLLTDSAVPFLAAPVQVRPPGALGFRIACWNGDLADVRPLLHYWHAPPLKRPGPRRRRSFPRPPRSCLLARNRCARARTRFRFTEARGHLKDAGIERDLRDAVAGTIYPGTSVIQRMVLVRMLGI
jgi:alkylation response protein AidB-like acyl-CoA dehydrogenase